MTTSLLSPISKSKNVDLDRSIAPAQLIEVWRKYYQIDVCRLVCDHAKIGLFRCRQSQLRFFEPAIAGDEQFYNDLQRFPWYYKKRKWEYSLCRGILDPSWRIVDIGCGDGAFVEDAARFVREAVGLEVNLKAVSAARSRGLHVEHGCVRDFAAHNEEGFDCVTSFQVLEHVSNPYDYLESLVRLLRKGGRLVIGVPNADGWLANAGGVLQWPPHHLSWWNSASLTYLTKILPIELDAINVEPLREDQLEGWILSVVSPRPVPMVVPRSLKRGLIRRAMRGVMGCARIDSLDGDSILAIYTKR